MGVVVGAFAHVSEGEVRFDFEHVDGLMPEQLLVERRIENLPYICVGAL